VNEFATTVREQLPGSVIVVRSKSGYNPARMGLRIRVSDIRELESRLFQQPTSDRLLYHYTTVAALKSIVESQHLHVSDIRYMNDASELSHGIEMMKRIAASCSPSDPDPAAAGLIETLSHPGVFVGCFSTEANLLSQWRGYCARGQGVSIGFRPDALVRAATAQRFSLGQCVYEDDQQGKVASSLLLCVEDIPDGEPAYENTADLSDDESFDWTVSLPRIAALLKNPAFAEEKEWRLVSHYELTLEDEGISYRPGPSMLIPYWRFKLPTRDNGSLDIEHVFIGPTPHPDESVRSLKRFLSRHASIERGVEYCGIPLRES
jgi:hypothetical protein